MTLQSSLQSRKQRQALLAQGGQVQVTVVAVFPQPFFQRLQALLQLRDQLISLGQLLTQCSILLFQGVDSFFWTHVATLQFLRLFGKSLGDLSSYAQQKVSGCFRTPVGAQIFCRNRSYLSSLRKQGFNLFTALQQTFLGHPLLPALQGS